MGFRRCVAGVVAAVLVSVTGCTAERSDPPTAWQEPSVPSPPSPRPSPSPSPSPSAPTSASASPARVVIPAGVTAGIAVFDRSSGQFAVRHDADRRFRSASLVKLLIALDHLWNRGPSYQVPEGDRRRFELMLRSSDDDAATYFYRKNGRGAVVSRMVQRLGLERTRPPTAPRSGWGSTALSAADVVRVYRYVLDEAPAPVRKLIMDNLRKSTRCGTDGFDQSFGIPSAFERPWAAKQGWYEFAGTPTAPGCGARPAAATGTGVLAPVGRPEAALGRGRPGAERDGEEPDWDGEVLSTTGVVGAGDRSIVVVLTIHRSGTPFRKAADTVTALTRSLPVPR